MTKAMRLRIWSYARQVLIKKMEVDGDAETHGCSKEFVKAKNIHNMEKYLHVW